MRLGRGALAAVLMGLAALWGSSWIPAPPGHTRLDLMDDMGVSHNIVYPNVGGFGNQNFLRIEDRALRIACVEIYNDAMAERLLAHRHKLEELSVRDGLTGLYNRRELEKRLHQEIQDVGAAGHGGA